MNKDKAITNDELVYPLESKPPWGEAFIVGFQHVLAMFAGIVTPPLIVAGALKMDIQEKAFFIGMALFASGAATFIQVRRFGPVGSGLLSVQGTSFTFLNPAIQAGAAGGLPLILGMSIAGAPAEMLVSRLIAYARRLFPPIVTGTAVSLIGLSLIKVGMTNVGGGFSAGDAFGSYTHLGLASLVLAVIVLLNRFGSPFLRVGAIMIGIVVGYSFAAVHGLIDFSVLDKTPWFNFPQPLKYGLAFDWRHFLPWFLAYLVTSVESVGDLTATSLVSNEPISGDTYRKRIAGGTLADALGSILAAVFNSLPNTTFSQNNGVIQLTGVASRRVGFAVSGILIVLGLCPKLGAIIGLMPNAVLGGATLALFGMVAAAGIRILSMARLDGRGMMILAIGLATGMGIEMVPNVLQKLPELVKITLGTGLVTGTIVALILNLVFPETKD